MSIITNKNTTTLFDFVSLGYYGQKPSGKDYPEELRNPQLIPQAPETYIEMCKRYVWTVLPLMTLVKPVGLAVTVVSEMAKTAKSVDLMMKYRTLESVSYNAFKTVLSAGTVAATVIEPFSPVVRRLFIGIQLVSLAHQIALQLYRFDENNADDYKCCKLVTHVLSNILAMAALYSQNLFVTGCFFLVQGMTALLHALKQLDKENYLAASVDAIMGCVRFAQVYQVHKQIVEADREEWERFFSKFKEPKQRIDSREPLKQQLTEQEEELRKFCGEEYLYFKQNGPEEKFLILIAEADHNGALRPIYLKPLIDQLSKRFDVKLRTISVIEDIPREITTAAQFGPITGLMLSIHGSFLGMEISDDLNNGLLTNGNITSDLFSGLDPRCVITLYSCNTAKYPYISVAYRVANASKRITFAPNNLPNGIMLKQLDPLEFSFEKPGKPVKTKKIEPLADDSFTTYLKSLFASKKENISVQNNSNSD
jgi:hypothetical protein